MKHMLVAGAVLLVALVAWVLVETRRASAPAPLSEAAPPRPAASVPEPSPAPVVSVPEPPAEPPAGRPAEAVLVAPAGDVPVREVAERRPPSGPRGRVVVPRGTPPDEHYHVYVSTGIEGAFWREIEVARDDTFVVADPHTDPPTFAMTAAYLRLLENEPDSEDEVLVLRPELGGRVVGEVRASWATRPETLINAFAGRLPASAAEWEDWPAPNGVRRPDYLGYVQVKDGAFELGGLPTGVPLVIALHGEEGWPVRESVVLAPGETRRLAFVMEKGVTLAGTLVSANPEFDAYAYRVVVDLWQQGWWETVYEERMNHPDGEFRYTGLPPGRLALWAIGPTRGRLEMEAAAGDVLEGLTVDVGRDTTIEGVVVWDDGTPVERAVVVARGPQGRRYEIDTKEGAFVFEHAGPHGPWSLTAELATRGGMARVSSRAVEVSAPARGVRIELDRLARVSGVVIAPDGEPARDALVSLSGGIHGLLETSGTFHFAALPGRTTLRPYADGSAAGEPVELELRSGQVVDGVTLVLGGAGTTLTGVVLSPDGNPAEGARVRASDAGPPSKETSSIERQATTDATGRFTLPHLPRGTVWVTAQQAPQVFDAASLYVSERGDLSRSRTPWRSTVERLSLSGDGVRELQLLLQRE